MKFKGPFVTLLAGVAVAAVLFGLSVAAKRVNTAQAVSETPNTPGPVASQLAAPPSPTPAPAPTTPPPPVGPTEATYAGRVDGGAAALAIVVKNDRVVAYLCDGRRLEAWLQGTAVDGKLALTGKNGETLTGTYTAASATGTVTAAGRTWTFTLNLAKAPSGLYRSTANLRSRIDAAWIVDGGQQTGLYTPGGGTPSGAPALDTNSLTSQIDGVTVTAQPVAP